MSRASRQRLLRLGAPVAVLILVLILSTWIGLQPIADTLPPGTSAARQLSFVDRHGQSLTVTYRNRWNRYDRVALYRMPPLLQKAMIVSEDKRYYQHNGVDWLARMHAVKQNLLAMRVRRGASTISEQVVRLLHPRPRSLWSRWLEGFEARKLEQRFSKAEILEFYLNQVPYARNRRGVAQAARLYFDRELDTLSDKEVLALVVLVRAPDRFDLIRHPRALMVPLNRLVKKLHKQKIIDEKSYRKIMRARLVIKPSEQVPVDAAHFVAYLKQQGVSSDSNSVRVMTTLDGSLQQRVQRILDQRLQGLYKRQVVNGAVLVVDRQRNEVLAWVNGGGFFSGWPGSRIDAVTALRQPGSTLKPFAYAIALEKDWTAATLIDDTPIAQRVGSGLHLYRNYSRRHYGPLRLREALGNSLNIPAVQVVQYVGRVNFLRRLRALGFVSLDRHPDFYGDGLVLGNGEVRLLELVQAYSVLARGGVYRPLTLVLNDYGSVKEPYRIYSAEVSSLIANILSDPQARQLEFGGGTLLNLPVQTAIKTGTSSDYRDAWAIGFNHRYTVGVWMGNLDRRPMLEVSGSIGPAVVLRSVFAELNRYQLSKPLFLSRQLKKLRICRNNGELATPGCPSMVEWFIAGNVPKTNRFLQNGRQLSTLINDKSEHQTVVPRLLQPTAGLLLAMDPRIPDELERFPFKLTGDPAIKKVEWLVDGQVVGQTGGKPHIFLWKLTRGQHRVQARVWMVRQDHPRLTAAVLYRVK